MFKPKYKVGDIVKAEIFKNEWGLCRVERVFKKKFFKFEYSLLCSSLRGGNINIYLIRKQKDLISIKENSMLQKDIERFEIFGVDGKWLIKDNEQLPNLLDCYQSCVRLNQQDQRIVYLEEQLKKLGAEDE